MVHLCKLGLGELALQLGFSAIILQMGQEPPRLLLRLISFHRAGGGT